VAETGLAFSKRTYLAFTAIADGASSELQIQISTNRHRSRTNPMEFVDQVIAGLGVPIHEGVYEKPNVSNQTCNTQFTRRPMLALLAAGIFSCTRRIAGAAAGPSHHRDQTAAKTNSGR